MSSNGLHQFLRELGPGIITGAADDDPSGISTYSVAGASYGYATLWTALLSFPLMAAVQFMCAKLGMVTGCGLASVIRTRYPRWVLWISCCLVIVANIFNIGADLGGMADAMQMMTGVPAYYWTPLFAGVIVALLFPTSYRLMARIFKWLTLVLFAYIITAFLAHPDWRAVFHSTFIPHLEWTKAYISVLVAILGTTISPYLFFWQAAQEVKEDRSLGKATVAQRKGSTNAEIRSAKRDVVTGMLLSNVVMYFLILTTAATLNAHGHNDIETAKQAAEALRPLAGAGAYWLFTMGMIGTGMLAVPVLAGSCAYAVAEGAHWGGGIAELRAATCSQVLWSHRHLHRSRSSVGLRSLQCCQDAVLVCHSQRSARPTCRHGRPSDQRQESDGLPHEHTRHEVAGLDMRHDHDCRRRWPDRVFDLTPNQTLWRIIGLHTNGFYLLFRVTPAVFEMCGLMICCECDGARS